MRIEGRRLRRPLGEKRYKKLFVIAAEGRKTEPQYFNLFNRLLDDVHVLHVRSRHGSAPQQVLARMERYLEANMGGGGSPSGPYEAWMVVDRNSWPKKDLVPLYEWSKTRPQYGFALSNPNFEYWLLLHFENGKGIQSARECAKRLKKHLPDYNKGIDARKFTLERIQDALRRAEAHGSKAGGAWPGFCGTTVYKLVRHILQT